MTHRNSAPSSEVRQFLKILFFMISFSFSRNELRLYINDCGDISGFRRSSSGSLGYRI